MDYKVIHIDSVLNLLSYEESIQSCLNAQLALGYQLVNILRNELLIFYKEA